MSVGVFLKALLVHCSMYHGKADSSISTYSSAWFYKQVQHELMPRRDNVDDFFRYFEVPGMYHCKSTQMYAPWFIIGASQANSLATSANPIDKEHDALAVFMVGWKVTGRCRVSWLLNV